MAVTIKGLQIPVSCAFCWFGSRVDNDRTMCSLHPIEVAQYDNNGIPKHCPLSEQPDIIRCKDCLENNQCSIQFKFAYPDNPGEWFCANGELATTKQYPLKDFERQSTVSKIVPINSYGTFRCGNCRNIVGYNDGHGHGYQNNFCSKCGRPVKWF